MDGNGNDREVKVVKHDIDVLVDSSLQAQVQVQCPATDVLQRAGIFRPARVKTGEKKTKKSQGTTRDRKFTNPSGNKTVTTPTCSRHL